MKHLRLFPFLLMILIAAANPVIGQDDEPENPTVDQRADDRRPNLLAELGLTAEQVQQIKLINRERRPRMIEAHRRLRVANRELDAAIYRDSVSEEAFKSRLKELQEAQAELARLRFESELSIRRILTQDQLVRFRELRQRFAEDRRENMQFRRDRRGRDGLRRFRQMRNRGLPKNE